MDVLMLVATAPLWLAALRCVWEILHAPREHEVRPRAWAMDGWE